MERSGEKLAILKLTNLVNLKASPKFIFNWRRDPVKAPRPGVHHGPTPPQPSPRHPPTHLQQLQRLQAEAAEKEAEARQAKAEREAAGRGLEALTVLLHHLTTTYDPFSTPRLKSEVARLEAQVTESLLKLDESSAALRRAEESSESREQHHQQEVSQLHLQHQQALDHLALAHRQDTCRALEKHREELSKFAEEQQQQREDVSKAHTTEVERLEEEWSRKLDLQHDKHLCALQDLNTQHTHKVRELEVSFRAREAELEESRERLVAEQETLKQEARRLQDTLLNDTDHRLLAVRKMCSSLKNEVDSLKTVVEMKTAEIHELRGQVAETERLGVDLGAARERIRTLRAKTEDLQAQMERRVQQERHLVNEHRVLVETYQREVSNNKRLTLENEQLAWKLRHRDDIAAPTSTPPPTTSTPAPTSTLDVVVSRGGGSPRLPEGTLTPPHLPHHHHHHHRTHRVAVRSPSGKVSPSKCEVGKRRPHLGLSPQNGLGGGGEENGGDLGQEVSFESPPPSPCVKAVVEKSNSVSFILDLNDSQSDDSFLELPASPRRAPRRTASLSAADRPRPTPLPTPHSRRVLRNNHTNSLGRNGLRGPRGETAPSRHTPEINGKGSTPEKTPGKGEVNGRWRRTGSESSEGGGGGEVERVSPTGLAWTVPVHPPRSPPAPKMAVPPPPHHLLEDPEEDEYEEGPASTHRFIEVSGLTSSSEAASDSEISQCDGKRGGGRGRGGSGGGSSSSSSSSSSESESESSDGDRRRCNPGLWCPKEGAGEAMITDDLLKQYAGDHQISMVHHLPPPATTPPPPTSATAHSSDSEGNVTPQHHDASWSEDVTSSSEMHEL